MKTTSKSSYIGIAADHRGCGFCVCTYAEKRYTITAFATYEHTSLKQLKKEIGALKRLSTVHIIYPDLTVAKWFGSGTGYRALEPQLDPLVGLATVYSAYTEGLVMEVKETEIDREITTLSKAIEDVPVLSVAAVTLIRSVGELYAARTFHAASKPLAGASKVRKLLSYR